MHRNRSCRTVSDARIDEPIPKPDPENAWDFDTEIYCNPILEAAVTFGVFDAEIRVLIEFKYINNTKLSHIV